MPAAVRRSPPGVRRRHRVEVQLGDDERDLLVAAARGRQLAACMREWAIAYAMTIGGDWPEDE